MQPSTVQPRIVISEEKKLIGKRLTMTFANNQTGKLWQSFMPKRNQIKNNAGPELVSMQIYPSGFNFTNMDVTMPFEKWAAVEVTSSDFIPPEMELFNLPKGTYAVFHYQGLNTDPQIFKYIFGTWLPDSGYVIDNRPHFEILGEKYKNNDPTSEEEIWIPIKPRP